MTILFQNLQITGSDIKPHIKWDVSLVIAYGHFNLPPGFVWACLGQHTHFITPEGNKNTGGKNVSCCEGDIAAVVRRIFGSSTT